MAYLTIPEAALKLNTPEKTIRNWCQNGKLIAHKYGRDWIIEIDSQRFPAFRKEK